MFFAGWWRSVLWPRGMTPLVPAWSHRSNRDEERIARAGFEALGGTRDEGAMSRDDVTGDGFLGWSCRANFSLAESPCVASGCSAIRCIEPQPLAAPSCWSA